MGGKRANGEGTVRKRTDGRWEGFITVGHKENGKPIYKSVFAKTQKELMPKLRKLIEDYKGVELTEESSMTVRGWLDKWLKVSRLIKRRTVAQEACDGGRVSVNGVVAKPSRNVKVGDTIEVSFGTKTLRAEILSVQETVRKDDAAAMYKEL